MQSTRAVFCDPGRVAPAAGSGYASMPVVLEAGTLLLDSPDIREMRSNHSYEGRTAIILVEEPIRLVHSKGYDCF